MSKPATGNAAAAGTVLLTLCAGQFLMALDSSVKTLGPDGSRQIGLEKFFLDYFETALGKNEFLTDILVPSHPALVRVYMVVIGVMSTLACGVTAAGGPWAVAVGALAFTASDISVARDRFVRHEFLNRAWGLPLYYGAQLLIASTSGLA